MGRLQFMDLIEDVQRLIIDHVTRPTDMKNLCLTCKQLHRLTVPQLYNEVTIDIGTANDTRLLDFLNPGNIGLPYVRKIDLYLAEVVDKCNQIQLANFTIRAILALLPENILEKFSWHPWSQFSTDNLILLYKKQRRMKWMEAIACDRDALPEIQTIPNIKNVFSQVKKLGLYPDSREVLNYCNYLVKNSPKVQKITLHSSFDDLLTDVSSRELNDSSTGPGLLTGTIFSHMLPFDKCTPIVLRNLTLQKIALRYASNTYCKIIDFGHLKSLRIFGCPGADALFAELSKITLMPEKLETLEFKHDDNTENDALHALEGFLCLVSGIRVLTVDMCFVKSLPAVACITRHGRTLNQLNLHASLGGGEDEEHVYDYESFHSICKACVRLEQLSIAFPQTNVLRNLSAEFLAFDSALSHLSGLITLNITTFPTIATSLTRLPRTLYETLLAALAKLYLTPHGPHPLHFAPNPSVPAPQTRLAVLAFGVSDKVYDREDSKNQLIFIKGTTRDTLGRERTAAVRCSWCQKKYVEPRSDILDFSLSRTTRMPVREDGGSVDSD
ncbi:hypothetical protein M501DRAFT_942665 [Patellaria atrata CBS 101060]|uniref:Uncharacterized protein n=1 Tax=Patellaria atrata CBS 101060 TaxID=1346257 RepID=A0A9P4S3T7_9PEZI|nr:hypothetical protein M501DRAFT_942665 [Patellaria atrata CBS 101060]